MAQENVAADVRLELEEMKKLDMNVPDSALAYVDTHVAEIQEYRDNGMKISEIADLVINLAPMAQRKAP